jgi:putative Holliday junction resolvase
MAICNPNELKPLLAKGARLLGLDVGTKTIGMALSDTSLMIATPFGTIRRTKFGTDVQTILAHIAKQGVGGVIVGLPLSMDGSDSPRTQGTRQFAKNLMAHTDLPIAFWDERLSTAAVERGMIEGDLTRRRRAEIIDKAAAAYILQGVLDNLNHQHTRPSSF